MTPRCGKRLSRAVQFRTWRHSLLRSSCCCQINGQCILYSACRRAGNCAAFKGSATRSDTVPPRRSVGTQHRLWRTKLAWWHATCWPLPMLHMPRAGLQQAMCSLRYLLQLLLLLLPMQRSALNRHVVMKLVTLMLQLLAQHMCPLCTLTCCTQI